MNANLEGVVSSVGFILSMIGIVLAVVGIIRFNKGKSYLILGLAFNILYIFSGLIIQLVEYIKLKN